MQPIDAHRIFQSLVLHCQGRYDVVQSGLVKIPRKTFEERYPVKIYKHFSNRFPLDEFKSYCISSIIAEPTISSIASLYNEEKYFNRKFDKYIKRRSRFLYHFEEELNGIFTSLDKSNFKFYDWIYGGGILSWYDKGKIYVDTFVLLEDAFRFLERGEKNNPLFNKIHLTFVEQYAKLESKKTKQKTKEIIEKVINERKKRRNDYGTFIGRI